MPNADDDGAHRGRIHHTGDVRSSLVHDGAVLTRCGQPVITATPVLQCSRPRRPGETGVFIPLSDGWPAGEGLLDWSARWSDVCLLFLHAVNEVPFTPRAVRQLRLEVTHT